MFLHKKNEYNLTYSECFSIVYVQNVFFLLSSNRISLVDFRNHLVECGLADECVRVARMASLEEIRSVHSETHTLSYGTDMLTSSASTAGATKLGGKLSLLSCGGLGVDSDTYWNERFTGVAARTAVGSVVELSTKVRLLGTLFLSHLLLMVTKKERLNMT